MSKRKITEDTNPEEPEVININASQNLQSNIINQPTIYTIGPDGQLQKVKIFIFKVNYYINLWGRLDNLESHIIESHTNASRLH